MNQSKSSKTGPGSERAQIGLIGLGVMGRNLALNVADHDTPIAVWNRDPLKVQNFLAENPRPELVPAGSLQELIARLERPRRVLLMVAAGAAVDGVIESLVPLLEEGDIVIDGGNTWYEDTRRRERQLRERGLHFLGVGISGGEAGARFGPAIMPGGDPESYAAIKPILEAIAARTEAGPCVSLVGPDGAGHFVKMVHNGIEYADMQFIAEVYDFLHRALGLDADQLAEIFEEWNRGPLESYLIEITAKIMRVRDPESSEPLLDSVLDKAGQKGTGRWTVQSALELGVPVPSIAAAVDARVLSSMRDERLRASEMLRRGGEDPLLLSDLLRKGLENVESVRNALLAAKIIAYAQGMQLIRVASQHYDWSIDLSEVARIWKGGCIIRARLLDSIRRAYRSTPELPNLLVDGKLASLVHSLISSLREVVTLAQRAGVPTLAMGSALAYYDSYRSRELPQNLIQAQRDAFGAHTYQRRDDPGGPFIHTDWLG